MHIHKHTYTHTNTHKQIQTHSCIGIGTVINKLSISYVATADIKHIKKIVSVHLYCTYVCVNVTGLTTCWLTKWARKFTEAIQRFYKHTHTPCKMVCAILYYTHLVISTVTFLEVDDDSFDYQFTDLRKFGVHYGNQCSIHMSKGGRSSLSCYNRAAQ